MKKIETLKEAKNSTFRFVTIAIIMSFMIIFSAVLRSIIQDQSCLTRQVLFAIIGMFVLALLCGIGFRILYPPEKEKNSQNEIRSPYPF